MKKLMMVLMAATTMMLVGCGNKVSKFESLNREAAAIAEKAGGPKVSEKDIQKAVEEFKKLSDEGQDQAIKALEAMVDLAKAAQKKK